jgi:hypothetical protein
MNTKRKMKVMTVTPEIAAKWLKKNVHNRPLRPNAREEYTAAMKAGEWKLTAEPIAFSRAYTDSELKQFNEVLINGQHRLLAVIDSGATVTFTVWWGCEPDEFEVIDRGAKRTFGDVIATTRSDLNDPTLLASVCSSFGTLALGANRSSSNPLRQPHINEMLRVFPTELMAVVAYKKKLRKFAPRPVISALTLAQICNPTMTELIVNQLQDVVGFTPTDPIRALHLYLTAQLLPISRDTVDVVHYKVCHAICARLRGESIKRLYITGEGLGYLRDGARSRINPLVEAIHGPPIPVNFYTPKIMLVDGDPVDHAVAAAR